MCKVAQNRKIIYKISKPRCQIYQNYTKQVKPRQQNIN